jgi:membrane-bound transcription factor site-1 protease
VWELTANNVIMVSAIGNDGPLYGTLNNPADQMDVIGVGGIDYQDHIASFSSRGMTTWELPHGYGRVKPDIVAYGRDVVGSKMAGGCRSLSGTSVASPVVAGAVVLLCSVIPEAKRWQLLNPAVLKQALVESARRIDGPHIHEQGAGKLNLVGAYEILKNYKPRASVVPSHYDLGSCPYMWPYCRQPLYATAMPLVLNATIVNGMGLTGWLEQPPQWFPGRNGKHLDLRFEYPKKLWPWSGYLALYVRVKEDSSKFSGTAEGTVKFEVVSPPGPGERTERRSTVTLTLRAPVIETPPRRQRLLWDNYHSVRYPPGYIPRDSLDVRQDILDWHGDHPHTNYHDMFNSLRDKGYYVEMLGSPFTCFQAENYKALLLVDSEEEYHPEERAKLTADINQRGLSLLVFADWYNVETMVKMRFFDDNTRSWWTPATGGANVPALNDLLEPWGIAFGDTVINGRFELQRRSITFASGAPLVQFPKGGLVHSFHFTEKSATKGGVVTGNRGNNYPVMGFFHPHNSPHAGKIVVHGDSNCLDSSHMAANQDGFLLLAKMLEYCETGVPDGNFFPRVSPLVEPLKPGAGWSSALPQRRTDVDFAEFSRVLNQPAVCGPDAPLQLVTPVGGGVPVVLASTDSAAEVSQGGGGHVAADNTHGAPKSVDIEALTAQKAHGATIEAHGDVDAQSTSVPQAHAAVESGRVEVQRTATPEATRGVALVAGGTTGSVYDQAPAEVDKELEEPKSEEALEENEQLQSAVVSSIVHHTSQVDPVHRAENEAFGMESTVGGLRSRVKYMMALSAGLLVGTFVGLTQALFRRKRSAASGTGKTSSRARSGRSGRSTGARGTTAALLSK